MTGRWFSDEELRQLSRPTMDGAIEALDRGDVARARALCEEMKREWRYLHDLMVERIAGLISFVQERLGEDGVADAWTYGLERQAGLASDFCLRPKRSGAAGSQ